MVKNSLASVGDAGDMGLIPGSGRSSGVVNGNPLQFIFPGKFCRQWSLMGYSPGGCRESDTTRHDKAEDKCK